MMKSHGRSSHIIRPCTEDPDSQNTIISNTQNATISELNWFVGFCVYSN